jgi:hypothetical protein
MDCSPIPAVASRFSWAGQTRENQYGCSDDTAIHRGTRWSGWAPGRREIGEEKCHAASRYLSGLIVAVVPLGAMTVDAQEPMHYGPAISLEEAKGIMAGAEAEKVSPSKSVSVV